MTNRPFKKRPTHEPAADLRAAMAKLRTTAGGIVGVAASVVHLVGSAAAALVRANPVATRRAVQIGALALLAAFPIKTLLTDKPENHSGSIENIIENQILSIASVQNATPNRSSVVYNDHGLLHGFGYDVARLYAKNLGVELALITYPTMDAAMQALQTGAADMLLLPQSQLPDDKTLADTLSAAVACDATTESRVNKAGLESLVFLTTTNNAATFDAMNAFLCTQSMQRTIGYLADFHNNTLLDNAYNDKHFKAAMGKLSLYESAFRASAQDFGHDWQLLAMIAYQESRFNTKAVSHTGVQGMMMLTQDTAKMMGVTNRNDVEQSIHGGAKYLQKLEQQFSHIDAADRLWFVLAAYNMGPNAVRDIQTTLKQQNKDANLWINVYAYMLDNAHKNSRYKQCVHYVTNIRSYIEAIKTQ